jgi:transposase
VFVRLKKTPKSKNPTVQVVESIRHGDKIQQKIIASLGVLRDEKDRERMIQMGRVLIAKLAREKEAVNPQLTLGASISDVDYDDNGVSKPRVVKGELPVYPSNLVHVRTETCGFSDVFGELFKALGFASILAEADQSSRCTFNTLEIIRTLVSRRIQSPASKRRSLFLEANDKGYLPHAPQHMYRAMDVLLPCEESLKAAANLAAVGLLGRKLECFFYDATTLFFESISEDDIRAFGYSKDGKFNQVQVLLCLIVTEEGLPVGYEIFPGNTSEKTTLDAALKKLALRYPVTGHTIVADRGILSQPNAEIVASHKMNFIMGERLRGLSKSHHESILDINQYQAVGDRGDFFIRDIPHPSRGEGIRLILGYSKDRAKKDRTDRERLIKKLEKKLAKKKKTEPKEFISNRGVLKYVTATGGEAKFNREAIAKDERWDGFFGIATNHPTLSASAVLAQYRGLWQVEAQFRVYKHNLETRPIFHWTSQRIKAHVLICFMALCLERHLEVGLKKIGTALTTQNIYDALNGCQTVFVQDKKTKRMFQMGSNKSEEAKQIYLAVNLSPHSKTVELENPGALVVPTAHSVRPQLYGMP